VAGALAAAAVLVVLVGVGGSGEGTTKLAAMATRTRTKRAKMVVSTCLKSWSSERSPQVGNVLEVVYTVEVEVELQTKANQLSSV
jgi:hypothetical protein